MGVVAGDRLGGLVFFVSDSSTRGCSGVAFGFPNCVSEHAQVDVIHLKHWSHRGLVAISFQVSAVVRL